MNTALFVIELAGRLEGGHVLAPFQLAVLSLLDAAVALRQDCLGSEDAQIAWQSAVQDFEDTIHRQAEEAQP